MTTPVKEIREPQYRPIQYPNERSSNSDDEGTLSNEFDRPERINTDQQYQNEKLGEDYDSVQRTDTMEQSFLGGKTSLSQSREEEQKLEDDLAMLQAEQNVSRTETNHHLGLTRSRTIHRSRSRQEPVDSFDVNTNPIHEKASGFRPPEHPEGNFAKVFKRVHDSNFLVRYFMYIVPLVIIILVPLLLGGIVFKRATVGGVRLLWFCVWLEIVWLTLWGGRILAKSLPWPVGLISSIFTNNSKKWRDMCKQLELPATLFFWLLAVLISFLPVMIHHHLEGGPVTRPWEVAMNKVIISLFTGATLNFGEKIIIQLIAISFHLRTYADRIEINKFQIGSLTKLYLYSKEKIAMEDSDFEERTPSGPGSGARTPMQLLNEAQKKTQSVFGKVGDVAGKVAGDFTGKAVTKSTHPRQLVLTLLNSPPSSQVLARRLYRTFVREDADTVVAEDLKHAFDNDEEAESAFNMFDKDMNGDISMAELEAVCVDIGKERKSITASLKDLDSVVAKLDAILLFFVLVVTILVFLSLISTSAAGVLTSAGSTVLALSWLFSTTAQEFLASCIFVLVKHPFDVGDRVTIYGNTGAMLKGDDYLVKEISLLYTEFKKMEGHIVQAPNSYLNTLFILNMRRSGGLAEAVPMTFKFGTTLEEIDELRSRLLEFVKAEKREYQANILTEIRDIVEAYSLNVNIIFFYKSNWQNEALRLQRRNKFICAMMIAMQEIGIEGPRRNMPGCKDDKPFYYQAAGGRVVEMLEGTNNNPNEPTNTTDTQTGPGPRSGSLAREPSRTRSILRGCRPRNESISSLSRRVDFLNVSSSADIMADIPENRDHQRIHNIRTGSTSRSREARQRIIEEDNEERRREDDAAIRRAESRTNGGSRSPFGLKRVSTDEQGKMRRGNSFVHRNRFFSRSRRRGNDDDGDEVEDLMEQGMADIPEIPTSDKMDPRTGTISSQAVRSNTNDSEYSNVNLSPVRVPPPATSASGALPPTFEHRLQQPQGRVATTTGEDFELKSIPHYPGT